MPAQGRVLFFFFLIFVLFQSRTREVCGPVVGTGRVRLEQVMCHLLLKNCPEPYSFYFLSVPNFSLV